MWIRNRRRSRFKSGSAMSVDLRYFHLPLGSQISDRPRWIVRKRRPTSSLRRRFHSLARGRLWGAHSVRPVDRPLLPRYADGTSQEHEHRPRQDSWRLEPRRLSIFRAQSTLAFMGWRRVGGLRRRRLSSALPQGTGLPAQLTPKRERRTHPFGLPIQPLTPHERATQLICVYLVLDPNLRKRSQSSAIHCRRY